MPQRSMRAPGRRSTAWPGARQHSRWPRSRDAWSEDLHLPLKLVPCTSYLPRVAALFVSCDRCDYAMRPPTRGRAPAQDTSRASPAARQTDTSHNSIQQSEQRLCFGIELPDADVLPSNPSRWRESSVVQSRMGVHLQYKTLPSSRTEVPNSARFQLFCFALGVWNETPPQTKTSSSSIMNCFQHTPESCGALHNPCGGAPHKESISPQTRPNRLHNPRLPIQAPCTSAFAPHLPLFA